MPYMDDARWLRQDLEALEGLPDDQPYIPRRSVARHLLQAVLHLDNGMVEHREQLHDLTKRMDQAEDRQSRLSERLDHARRGGETGPMAAEPGRFDSFRGAVAPIGVMAGVLFLASNLELLDVLARLLDVLGFGE